MASAFHQCEDHSQYMLLPHKSCCRNRIQTRQYTSARMVCIVARRLAQVPEKKSMACHTQHLVGGDSGRHVHDVHRIVKRVIADTITATH